MLPLDNHSILIGTRQEGLFLYDGASVSPFPSNANQLLIEKHLYQGLALPDSTFAFATSRGGLVLIDKNGHLLRVINQATGLPSNSVYNLGIDNQGGWWLALDKDISRIELNSPFSVLGELSGLEGTVSDIVRHQGQLYVSTTLGVYVLESPLPEARTNGKPACCRECRTTAGAFYQMENGCSWLRIKEFAN